MADDAADGGVFGTIGGVAVRSLILTNGRGITARVIPYGARLVGLHVPDRHGVPGDIVLGFDTLDDYIASPSYFGATCGRYGNRIARGRFALAGAAVQVDTNEGANHLHGGSEGFDRKLWSVAEETAARVVLTARSEDGEMGFPGACTLAVTYAVTDANELHITMTAETTRTTVMNMVHHSYFNLAGTGSVLAQELRLNSRFYTPVDAELLATGEVLSVQGTPFDFSAAKPIGRDIGALDGIGAGVFDDGGGYDHNWCLGDAGADLRDCCAVHDPASGRRMTLRTSEPGVQIYIGGYLSDAVIGKGGRPMGKYAGFTLETQTFPGAPNHAHFPDCTLHPGARYCHRMIFGFSTDADGA